jgi:hypothetical protein
MIKHARIAKANVVAGFVAARARRDVEVDTALTTFEVMAILF